MEIFMKHKQHTLESAEFGKMDVFFIDGIMYFPATACAKILDFANPYDAIQRSCPNKIKLHVDIETGLKPNGSKAIQIVSMNYIPEPDLICLIERSSAPAAKRFEKWIFTETIPSMTGRATTIPKLDEIQIFENECFGSLEIIMIGKRPYFHAADCAKILGYRNPQKAIFDHCKKTIKRGVLTSGGIRQANFIGESDLYRLIMHSQLPAAEKFQDWVVEDVLPMIHRHGAYFTNNILDNVSGNPRELEGLVEKINSEREKSKRLETENALMLPKVKYCDIVLHSDSAIPITIIAKEYGLSGSKFNKILHELGIQYKIRNTWVLYSGFSNLGFTISRTYHINENKSVIHTCWTELGRNWLYHTLKQHGRVPQAEFFTHVHRDDRQRD
jgi:prophage antirepressor-like protein